MTKPNENSFYYHYDDQGSVTNLTNKKGLEVLSTTYDPYGRQKTVTGTWKNNKYRYTTKEYEPHAGLYHYGARYYDPQIGRWLTPDPKGFIDGMNLYAFVGNNPVNYVDLWGFIKEKYKNYEIVKDALKHGGEHYDVYKNGKNIGRFRGDASPISFMGKTPVIPNGVANVIKKMSKVIPVVGIVSLIYDVFLGNPAIAYAPEIDTLSQEILMSSEQMQLNNMAGKGKGS